MYEHFVLFFHRGKEQRMRADNDLRALFELIIISLMNNSEQYAIVISKGSSGYRLTTRLGKKSHQPDGEKLCEAIQHWRTRFET